MLDFSLWVSASYRQRPDLKPFQEMTMSNRFIMTAFGKDRVGIVADVTRLLYENDCNLEDTTINMLPTSSP